MKGDDLRTVQGTASLLSKEIDERGKRRRIDSDTIGLGVLGVVSVLLFLLAAATVEPRRGDKLEGVLAVAVLLVGAALLVGTAVGITRLASWLRPRLEILAPNEKPRWVRMRARVFGGVFVVLVGVVFLLAEQWLF